MLVAFFHFAEIVAQPTISRQRLATDAKTSGELLYGR